MSFRTSFSGIVVCLAIGMAAPCPTLAGVPEAGDETVARYQAMSLDAAFAAVATGIRFEPYAGVVRGPVATALAHAGNAADQALLPLEWGDHRSAQHAQPGLLFEQVGR